MAIPFEVTAEVADRSCTIKGGKSSSQAGWRISGWVSQTVTAWPGSLSHRYLSNWIKCHR